MKAWVVFGLAAAMAAPGQEIRLTQVATGISGPTDIQAPADGSGRLFFVRQNGIVRVFRNGSLAAQPFLDITSKTQAGGERGLLGLAFPPGFAASQRFYVNYTDLNGDTTIAMYRVSSNPEVADAASETVLLKIAQPYANHNGGQIRFGPDGYLYIGMGDGGSAGDPQRNAQNRLSLLGKMLRLDVESDPGHIRIPPDNPFIALSSARGEIWALGLRNPWRFSFDRVTGDLWIGDVGQGQYEEVNFRFASSRGGENYGWNQAEGLHCYTAGCDLGAYVPPVVEYDHSLGCSVTGGFVYRGRASPGMRGIYLYADYCSGRIWGFELRGAGSNRLLLASGFAISTFGEDENGEIYLANAATGTIYRIEGSAAPRFTAESVVSASNFSPGLSPGSLATVFAVGVKDEPGITSADSLPLPTTLGGVSVLINGVAAPIHAIANVNGQEQVNFQVPFEAAGRATASIAVARRGAGSAAINVPVVEIQPGIFADSALNAIVVHNANYSLATPARPLVPGEFAFVYASGLGRVQNPPPTGAAAPASPPSATVAPVRVTVAGLDAEVPFAGLAPGLAGVYQLNFRVPLNAPSGPQDLRVSVEGAFSLALKVPVR
jgi:uncharacterized protein (TIGR03437 family)